MSDDELDELEREKVARWRRLLLGGDAERVEERGDALEDEREHGDGERPPKRHGAPDGIVSAREGERLG
jgi:hypothetical protein